MSQINIRNLSNENDDGSPEIVGVSTFSATSFFVPPKGSTAERPSDCEPGSIRFNTDTANLEYFRGNTLGWSQFDLVTPNLGGGTGSNTGVGVRALYGGGVNTSNAKVNIVDFLTISTMGDSQDFGDMPDTNTSTPGTCSSRTRGLFGGGYPYTNRICFFTFASTGNSTDHGDLTQSRSNLNGLGDGIRGVFVGGYTGSNQTTMDYITVAQTGNAVDFGDLSATSNSPLIANSSTRGLIGGVGSANVIDFITIATTGNAADFGDLTVARSGGAVGPLGNSIRGIFVSGYSGGDLNVLDFVTIATKANAQDFGDLAIIGASQTGAASSPTRGVIMGGIGGSPRAATNTTQKIEILTEGNSVDFGDITTARNGGGGISNAHGGL